MGLQPQTGPTASDRILTEETGRGQACSPPKGSWKTPHRLSLGEETPDGASGAVGPSSGPVGRPAWTGPGSSVCPPPGLLLGPRQVGMPPPGRSWEAGSAGLCGADPTPALCPRCLRALLRSLAARGQHGNRRGARREGARDTDLPLWLSSHSAGVPCLWGGPCQAVCSWPPPLGSGTPGCSACPGVAAAPAPHSVSSESCPVGGTDSAWAEPYLHLPPTPPGCWPGPPVRALSPCC